jgi:hypothetical protein
MWRSRRKLGYPALESEMPKFRSEARGHHHVPLMLQNAFATSAKGKKDQVFVFDKHEDRGFRTSPENILQERDFNTFDDGAAVLCLEDGLQSVEDKAAPVFRKIIAERAINGLSDEERAAACVFTALQKIRGTSVRFDMADFTQQISDRLRANGDDPSLVPQLQGGDDPEQIKLSALMLIKNNLGEFARSYVNKNMALIAAPPGETFVLGDCPVVLANQNDHAPYGNIGLEVKGIEIYLPIAPDLTLAFFCPSILEELKASIVRIEESLQRTGAAALLGLGLEADQLRQQREKLKRAVARLRQGVAAMETGTAAQYDHDNMDYLNSLQIGHAERYVLSANGDFKLVKQMIADNPARRFGWHAQLA